MVTDTITLIREADPILVEAFFENRRADEQLAALEAKCRLAIGALGSPVPEVFTAAASQLRTANNEVVRKRTVLRELHESILSAIAQDMAGVSEGLRVHIQYRQSGTTQAAADEVWEVAMLVKRLSCKWSADLVFPVLKGFRLREDGTLTHSQIAVDLQPGLSLTHLS